MAHRSVSGVLARMLISAWCVLSIFSVAHAEVVDRPLVFIPGITGSVLSDTEGEVVWGDLGSLRGSNFHKMNLLPVDGDPIGMEPTDALRDVPLLFGTIEVGLYSGLIDFLVGETSLTERLTGSVYKGDYVEGENLFVFAYDWRRSNFANALALDAFITENIPSGEYDLIAHSMGGLVTRIMLSQRGPSDLCTAQDATAAQLSEADFQDLCRAIYGPAPSGSYPSDHLNAARPAADRMHTFIEMAVPHYGSVNLAATLLEGWGKVSELLLGGKLAIQNTVLSLAAPVELLPTYTNCCARGEANATGNRPVEPHNEEFWLDLLLAFGQDPCPYDRCGVRRALFRNGIANRQIIDEIMDAGLPASVKANHGIVGRKVKNTREVVYVPFDSNGNGEGVTYRTGAEGDGTVHRISALLPNNKQTETFSNFAVVMHAGHPFIVGDEDATNYVFNTLIDPIDREIQPVSTKQLVFASGAVDELGLSLSEQVILAGGTADVTLRMTQQESLPFDATKLGTETVSIELKRVDIDAEPVVVGRLALDNQRSLVSFGSIVYSGEPITVAEPGIYNLRALSALGTVLAKSNLYVLEE